MTQPAHPDGNSALADMLKQLLTRMARLESQLEAGRSATAPAPKAHKEAEKAAKNGLEAYPYSVTTKGGRYHRLSAPTEREAEVAARAFATRTGNPVRLVDERTGAHRIIDSEPSAGGTGELFGFIERYRTYLEQKGDGETHCKQSVRNLRWAAHACKLDTIADLAKVEEIRAWLFDARKTEGISPRTANHRRAGLKSFCAWLTREGHLNRNPLVVLPRANEALDVRRKRRPLTAEEASRLLEATSASGLVIRSLGAGARALLYETALLTGLRVGELKQLVPSDFDFAANVLTVRAVTAKAKREDRLPLHPRLAPKLKAFVSGKAPGARLWPGGWWDRSADVLRQDLALAGIPFKDAQGRRADFHALRHSFGSNLALAGVHPKTAQILMRHSNVAITLAIYTHVDMKEQAAALAKLG